MTSLRYSKDDLLRGKIVDPGWYDAKVYDIKEYAAASDGSQNWDIHLRIIDGPFDGVPIKRTFNEKAPGFAIKYAEAFGFKTDPNGGEIPLMNTNGKNVRIYIKNELYNGRMTNKVEDFAPTTK